MPTLRAADAAATPSAGTSESIANPSWNSGTSSTPFGDIILIWCAAESSSITWSCPGFTAQAVAAGTSASCQLLYKTSVGTEGSTFTVTSSTSKQWAAVAISFFNQYQAAPFDPVPPHSGTVSSSASTTLANAGITTRSPGDTLVWFGAVFGTSLATITVPSGYTAEVSQTSSGTSGGGTSIITAIATDAGSGATGAVNGSANTTTLYATHLVGVQLPSPPAAFSDESGSRPRWAPRLRRGVTFAPLMNQANQGTQFPLVTAQNGSKPRWAARLRRGAFFNPAPSQANQGVPFPLFTRQPGSLPKWGAKLRRGAAFTPVPPQGNQGVPFPLFTRQRGGPLPKWAPKLRRGAFFLPGWGQAGDDPPATQLFRQPGQRPRWLPPKRLVSGRFFSPGWGQAPQGVPFPLFTRHATRTSVFAQLTRLRPSRTVMIPYVPQTRTAAIAWRATGTMTITADLTRHAALAMRGQGSMTISGVRITCGTLAMSASGSMRIGAVVTKSAALAMHGAGSMMISASVARVGALAMSASGSMTIAATDLPGLPMSARGQMTIGAVVLQQAALAMAADGVMAIGAESGAPPRLILIEPGGIASPAQVAASGSWQEQAPFTGPDEITVSEISDGQFDVAGE
jgi:hypothetical protein